MHTTFVISFNPSQQPNDTGTATLFFYRGENRSTTRTARGLWFGGGWPSALKHTHAETLTGPDTSFFPPEQAPALFSDLCNDTRGSAMSVL